MVGCQQSWKNTCRISQFWCCMPTTLPTTAIFTNTTSHQIITMCYTSWQLTCQAIQVKLFKHWRGQIHNIFQPLLEYV